MLHQSLCCGSGFDALCNQLKVECFSQPDDRADNRQIVGIGAEVTYKCGVDLERIDGEGLQVRQDGVTGTEVVDGDLDPDLFQLRQGSPSALNVVNYCALGDLEAQRSSINAEFLDGLCDRLDETSAGQLKRRDIDAQRCILPHAPRSPPAEIGTGVS